MKPQNGVDPSLDPIDILEANFKSVVEALTSGASSVETKVSGAKERATTSVTTFAAKATKAVKDHPIAAVGIAFGLGYLLMRLIRR
jgi:ElaB/YqjD/DUF883 family membrane-anchored ribosome-binding protein